VDAFGAGAVESAIVSAGSGRCNIKKDNIDVSATFGLKQIKK
jgi:hypothetical protein